MKLTTRQINEIVKNDELTREWGIWSIYNDKLVRGRRKLKYMRNGWRVPESMKKGILNNLTKKFKHADNIESIQWKVGEHYLGDYDYLRIVKVD